MIYLIRFLQQIYINKKKKGIVVFKTGSDTRTELSSESNLRLPPWWKTVFNAANFTWRVWDSLPTSIPSY